MDKCPKCGGKKFCIPINATFGCMTECIDCGWDWMDNYYHSNNWEVEYKKKPKEILEGYNNGLGI